MYEKIQIDWIKEVGRSAPHNAFTDLCQFNHQLFCTFREAQTHISGDGKIRVQRLNQSGNIGYQSLLQLQGVDLRDPKLSVTPDNKLLLSAYARHVDAQGKTLYSIPVYWFSGDGLSWSGSRFFGDRNWWLWRVCWHQGEALGFAYSRKQQRLRLYKGDPRRKFECIHEDVLSKETHGLGYPNESDVHFADNGTAYALIRRDADTCTAQLGIAKPPYKNWRWHDLKAYLGGPAMYQWKNIMLAAGRIWLPKGPKTAIYRLDINNKILKPELLLPSAGDSSYPGWAELNDNLYMSYYSCHEGNQSRIYLAKLRLNGG